MNMDPQKSKELLNILQQFLCTSASEEKDVWLDAFLVKFLHLTQQESQDHLMLCEGWGNLSNDIAHQLFHDMSQTCAQLNSSSTEAENEDEVKKLFSMHLTQYLLDGRGWKLLWVLKILGMKNSTCIGDLVNIIIGNMPVALSSPVFSSVLPDYVKSQLPYFGSSFPSEFLKKIAVGFHRPFQFYHKNKRKRLTTKQSELRLRRRLAKVKVSARASSGSETETLQNRRPSIIPVTQQKLLLKIHCPDNASKQKGCALDLNNPEDKNLSLNSVLSDSAVINFRECKPSMVDCVGIIIDLLINMAIVEQKYLTVSSSSLSMLKFSLVTLDHIETGYYKLEGWTEIEAKKLRNSLLQLLFLTIPVLKGLPGETSKSLINDILHTLFTFSLTMIMEGKLGQSSYEEDILFVCDVSVGILTLINDSMPLFSQDCAKLIFVIRTFSVCEGTRIFCHIVSYLERAGGFENCIVEILNIIKAIILNLKSLRLRHSQDLDNHVRSEKLSDQSHHHNDLLGSSLAHSVTFTEPMCCVSATSHLLLKLYYELNSKPMAKAALKAIQEAGICCCIDPGFILSIFLNRFLTKGPDIQCLILSVIEKVMWPQLGLIPYKSTTKCNVCEDRQSEIKFLPSFLSDAGVNYTHAFLNENLLTNFQLIKDYASNWKSLNVYSELLSVNKLQTVVYLTKHISHLFSSVIDNFKNEVFLRAVLPNLLKLVFEIRNNHVLNQLDQMRMECYLSLLPNLLSNNVASGIFIHFGGIGILYEILFFVPFRQLALQALEVLILSEIENENGSSEIATLYIQEAAVNNMSAMVSFSDILREYSRLFLHRISKLHYFCLPNVSEHPVKSTKKSNQCSTIHNYVSVEDAEFKTSLSFVCDLWITCKNIVLKTPACYVYISNTALSDSFDLFLALLQNLRTFSSTGDKEMFEKVLLLIQHLLIMFLHFKTSFPSLNERIPNKRELLKIVKTTVEDCRPDYFEDLKLLLHALLQCGLSESIGPKPSSFHVKKKLHVDEYSCMLKDSSTSSDTSDDDEGPVHGNYDADVEKSDDSVNEQPAPKSSSFENRTIQHGEVVKMVFNLLVCFLKEMEEMHVIPIAVHIFQTVLKYCYECDSNAVVLSQQDLCSELLNGFGDFLKEARPDIEDFQWTIIDLFVAVVQHSINDADLRKFVKLFESNAAPFNILVVALNTLLERTSTWPCHALSFPCAQTRLKAGRSENREKLKACLHLYDVYSLKKVICPCPNAWNTAAIIFPLPLDIKWSSFRRCYSSTMWVMLKPSLTDINGTSGNIDISEEPPASEDHSMCHLISFGSDTVLLETWINSVYGDLCFKINAYSSGEVSCLASATCKGIFRRGVWHHIALNYKETNEKKILNSKIHIIVDGCKEKTMNLKYENSVLKDSSSYFIHLGHASPQSENQPIVPSFYLGNLMLFKGEVVTKEIAFYLSSLGPDVTSITACPIQQRKVFFPAKAAFKNLNGSLDWNLFNGNNVVSLSSLQKNLLLSYSAENPALYALYPQSLGIIFPLLAPFASAGSFSSLSQHSWPSQKEPIHNKIVIAAQLQSKNRTSLFAAAEHIGGIPVFIFLFAKVVECCNDDETQALALQLLLHLITRNCYHSDYFFKIGGEQILHQLLLNKKCLLSPHMLSVCLDTCLSCSVLKRMPWPNNWSIDTQSDALIMYPSLFGLFSKAFLQSKNTEVHVKVLLINVIKLLLRENHRHISFNLQHIKSLQLMDILLNMLQDCYVLSDDHLPLEVTKGILQLIKRLICNPTNLKHLWSICNFLLLLHKASNTYICHARSSFYFLFASGSSSAKQNAKIDTLSSSASQATLSSNESSQEFYTSPSLRVPGKIRAFRIVKSMTDLKADDSEEPNMRRVSSFHDTSSTHGDEDKIDVKSDSETGEWEILKTVKFDELSFKQSPTNASDSDSAEVLDDEKNILPDIKEAMIEEDDESDSEKLTELVDGNNDKENSDRIEIYVGLLNLVQDIIDHADEDTRNLVLDVIQPEIFLVLVYNSNSSICCAVMGVILAYLQKATEDKISYFLSIKGFHLLGNQLHQLPADPLIAGSCISMMFFGKITAEDQSNMSKTVSNSLFLMSWIPTMAVLPNTSGDPNTCNAILGALINLVTETPWVVSELVNNGLCESLALLVFRSSCSLGSIYTDHYTGNNVIFKGVADILRIVSSDLFSSQDPNDFTNFCSMLQLFFKLEVQCCEECGSSSTCVAWLRDCQCIILQSALDFMEVYNFRRLKTEDNTDQGSLWEILMSMPEGLNPYSTFMMASAENSSSETRKKMFFYPDSTVSSSASESSVVLQNVERADHELPMSEAVERFQFVLSRSTDFVVFQDPNCVVTRTQKFFLRNLFYSTLKGLATMIEKNRVGSKTKWTAVVWSVKDSLRLQLSRLLVASLSPDQDLSEKLFILEALADQPKCAEILTSIIFTTTKIESLPIFLYDLRNYQVNFTLKHKRDFGLIFSHLKRNMQNLDLNQLRDDDFIESFKEEWRGLWQQDRKKWVSRQLRCERKLSKKLEKLAKQISEIAMDVTKKVVDLQSIERKKFMEEVKMKNSEDVSTREIWHSLIDQFTHERAVWYNKDSYPRSWELDPTEGPQRIRKRLRPCQLDIDPKFLLPEFRKNLEPTQHPMPFVSLLEHENGSSDSVLVINKLHANEKIEFTFPCKVVMPFEEAKGEILIGDHFLHFIGEERHKMQKVLSERWPFHNIKEILRRRFELQNMAIEIFMTNGLTCLVAFNTSKDLENMWKRLVDHNLPCVTEVNAFPLTQLWRDRSISNFDYLTQLNKLAGRSFNDLMQYPVFPFVLADFKNDVLDLTNAFSFRNLAKPIAVQNKAREEYYIRSYNSLKDELIFNPWSEGDALISCPYHYGSHYSNSGTVLHYLVRLLPYTYSLIEYQGSVKRMLKREKESSQSNAIRNAIYLSSSSEDDKNSSYLSPVKVPQPLKERDNSFDIPDRTFHSINTSWQLVTKDSTSDVKELIPEFFFLPEFLRNGEGFNFGKRQNGEQVNDIELPPWCKGDSRLFVLIQRQALESAYVINNLNYWIDLVFGYKQTGIAAVEAINVFQPATYYGFDFSKLEDSITRQALQATIKTVGQMPRQLFADPHPMMSLSHALMDSDRMQFSQVNVLDSVNGLKWGNYVGSPVTAAPNLVWRSRQSNLVSKLLSISTNDVFGLPPNICILLNHSNGKASSVSSATYIRSAALISWFHDDNIVRIKFCRDHPPLPLFRGNNMDPVCLCASVPDCSELFVAHESGTIFVYDLCIDSSKLTVTENRIPIQLNGHADRVTSIYICKAFSIVVTASKDKTCIIWDLNKLCYVRSILDHSKEVRLVCVSDTLGDIASVSNNANGSCLKVHTINGDLVGSVQTHDEITALCYSTAPEGLSVNVIATGMCDGVIKLWSSWDLKPIREIKTEKFIKPIACITFSFDNQHLYAANVDGTVAVWERPSQILMNIPRFLMFT